MLFVRTVIIILYIKNILNKYFEKPFGYRFENEVKKN
jgi:hypothetical protein